MSCILLYGELHDHGVLSVRKWFINVSERNNAFFSQRRDIETEIIEDKFELDFNLQDMEPIPPWLDEKIRPYFPMILQNFTRETFYYRSPVYEYMNIAQMWAHYFYTILVRNRIDLVIFSDIPHGGFILTTYFVAKALNIPTLILIPSGILGNFGYCFSLADYESFQNSPTYRRLPQDFMKVEKGYKKDLYYMKGKYAPKHLRSLGDRLKILRAPGAFLQERKNVFKRSLQKYSSFNEFLSKRIFVKIADFVEKKQYQKGVKRYTEKSVDFDLNYVYFPLHLQPEMTTDTLGGIYSDQLLALEKLRAMLPADWMIYVKENPKQTKFMRQDYFFKRLKLISNVKYVDRSIDTYRLMSRARFVSTITGTAGWEAISGGKNVLIFGSTWYEVFPGVFKYHANLNLEEILSYEIDHDELEQAVNRYLEKITEGIFLDIDKEVLSDFDPAENEVKLEKFFRFIIPYIEENMMAMKSGKKQEGGNIQ